MGNVLSKPMIQTELNQMRVYLSLKEYKHLWKKVYSYSSKPFYITNVENGSIDFTLKEKESST